MSKVCPCGTASPAQPQKPWAGIDASLCQGKMLWPHPKGSLGAGPAGRGVFGTCVWDLPNTSTSLDPQLFLSWKMGDTEAFGPLCFQIWGISRESHGSGLQGPVPGRAPQQSNRMRPLHPSSNTSWKSRDLLNPGLTPGIEELVKLMIQPSSLHQKLKIPIKNWINVSQPELSAF